jgi:phage tail sheath gpL-like
VPKEIFSLDEAATSYGTKNPLYIMARAWFRANKNMSVWCLPVPDRSSDVATKPTIVVDFNLIDIASAGEGKYIVAIANNTYTITATNWADFKIKFDLALASDASQPMSAAWSLIVAVPRLTLTPLNYGQVFDSVDVRFIQVVSFTFVQI